MSETIIQERAIAKFAFEKIKSVQNKNNIASDYKSYIRSLPSMILNNGLGNAIVFEFSKAKNDENSAHGTLLKDICEFAQKFLNFNGNETAFIERIMELTNEEYQYWTGQILKFLKWGRKFAEGMIKE